MSSKPSFQDILPPEKKSIRNIPISHPHRDPPIEKPHQSTPQREMPDYGRYGVMTVLVVLVIFGIYAISVYARGAVIKITPHQTTLPINLTITASNDASSTNLHYDVLTLDKTESETIISTTTAQVSNKASGTITVYNNWSAQPQTLIKNTRFETSGGLIFRIPNAITIPGKNGSTAGSVDTVVYADQPGADYNIQSSDFTIPGFKTDASRYKGFYAKTKNGISGGYVGVSASVSDTVRHSTVSDLDATLTKELKEGANTQKPDTFVMYDNGVKLSFVPLPDQTSSSSPTSIMINESANLRGIIFNRQELANYIASQAGNQLGMPEGEVEIPNLDSLNFTLQNGGSASSSKITFNLSGTAQIVSYVDEGQLKIDLAGKPKSDISSIIKNSYPNIDKIEVVIRPFWQSTVPEDVSSIVVNKVVNN